MKQKKINKNNMNTTSGSALRKEDVEGTLKSAIGVVFMRDKVLLGKAKTNDDRNGLWCFPGGGIEEGEDEINAAIREVQEEAGVKAIYRRGAKIIDGEVAFIGMDHLSGKLTPNFEFTEMGWFPINTPPSNLYPKNAKILEKICLL